MATKKSQDITMSDETSARPTKRRRLSPPSAASGAPKRTQGTKSGIKTKTMKSTSKKDLIPRPPRRRRSLQSRKPQRLAETPNLKSSQTASRANSKSNSGLSTPSSSDTNSHDKIIFVKSLLDQIWIRNKNQHRTQPWWKCLAMSRKAVTQLAVLGDKEQHFRQRTTDDNNGTTATSVDAKAVRARFEQESLLKKERELRTEWVRETVLPRSYVAFTSLVSDTQFAILGMVLVGLLSDLMGIVGPPTTTVTTTTVVRSSSNLATERQKSNSLMATSLRVTGLRTGEQIDRFYDGDDMGEVVERKPIPRNEKTSRTRKEQDTGSEPINKPKSAAPSTATALLLDDDDDDDDDEGEKPSIVQNKSPSRQIRKQSLHDTSSSSIGSQPTTKSQSSKRPLLRPPSSTNTKSGRTDLDDEKTTLPRKDEKEKTKKKKKKKSKGGAIDDLFAGLL